MSIVNPHRFAAAPPAFDFGNALKSTTANTRVIFTSTLSSGSGDFTWQFYYKPSTFSNQYLAFGSANSYISVLSASAIRLRLSANFNFTLTNAMVLNTWHHIIVSHHSGRVKVFVDNVEATNDFSLGAYAFTFLNLGGTGATVSWIGDMDEAAFKSGYGATTTDIHNLWNDGNGDDFASVISSPDLYYHLNELTGGIASDSSGNGNDGNLSNFPIDDSQWVAH